MRGEQTPVVRLLPALLCPVLVAVLAAGCGADPDERARPAVPTTSATSGPTPSSESPTEAPESPAPSGTEIVVADSEFGPMLFDDRRQAIYLFDVETSEEPRCYDECAEAWPPVLTEGEPVAGAGTDAALLATTEREDGTTQVTYAGHPLYFYAHEGPGEVKCHDVFLNGGTWYVVTPRGEPAA